MHPIFIEIFGRPIYWYGMFVATGFLCAVWNWNRLGKRDGYPPGFGSEMGFWIMVAGLVGARIAYVMANFDHYTAHPGEILRVDKGGLVFYGGLIGGFVGLLIFCRVKKRSIFEMGDYALTGLVLGHAFGRIGCFLNGCCFGSLCAAPLAVTFPPGSSASYQHVEMGLLAHAGLPSHAVHPTQLYEAGYAAILYVAMIWLYTRKRYHGQVAALYLTVYPVGRFLVEFLRGDPRAEWLGLNVAQDVSIALFMAGLLVWYLAKRSSSSQSA